MSAAAAARARAAGPTPLLLPPSTRRLLGQRLSGLALAVVAPVVAPGDPAPGPAWRFETSGGGALDLPLSAARAWERPPYAMPVRLVSARGEVLGEAVIGTRVGFDALVEKALATMLCLLRAALDGRAGPTAGPAPAAARSPGSLHLALAGGRVRHAAHRWRDRLLAEHWAIGVVAQPAGALLDGEPLGPVAWVHPGPFDDLADPHPWPGTDRVLCEEMPLDPPGAPGRILWLDLAGDPADAGRPASPRVAAGAIVLAGDMHRSYPGASVWEDGEVLLLPETPARGETTIHRLGDDGSLAPICRVAPELRIADPTLFWHGDRAWIAYTDLDIGAHDNLCLLHAPGPRGPWTPHRGNPVKLDIRSARPAGPVLRHRGALYRPAQDCARWYGAAVVLNRVEVLTTELFREVPVRRIEPPAGRFPHGLHTLAADGARLFVDGKRLAPRPGALAAKARGKAASLSRGLFGGAGHG